LIFETEEEEEEDENSEDENPEDDLLLRRERLKRFTQEMATFDAQEQTTHAATNPTGKFKIATLLSKCSFDNYQLCHYTRL
jgi:hypothetical protein